MNGRNPTPCTTPLTLIFARTVNDNVVAAYLILRWDAPASRNVSPNVFLSELPRNGDLYTFD
jgi:hypothetical protein